jgi:hypothetical protein
MGQWLCQMEVYRDGTDDASGVVDYTGGLITDPDDKESGNAQRLGRTIFTEGAGSSRQRILQ